MASAEFDGTGALERQPPVSALDQDVVDLVVAKQKLLELIGETTPETQAQVGKFLHTLFRDLLLHFRTTEQMQKEINMHRARAQEAEQQKRAAEALVKEKEECVHARDVELTYVKGQLSRRQQLLTESRQKYYEQMVLLREVMLQVVGCLLLPIFL